MPSTPSSGKPAALFGRSRVNRDKTTHIVNVRLSTAQVEALAEYGNANRLNLSDTLRAVLERGLACHE